MDKSVKKRKDFFAFSVFYGYVWMCVCALFYFVLDFLFFSSSSWPVTLMLCLSSQAVLLLSFNCKLCSQQVWERERDSDLSFSPTHLFPSSSSIHIRFIVLVLFLSISTVMFRLRFRNNCDNICSLSLFFSFGFPLSSLLVMCV